jgi:hypothetical protein
MIETRKNLSVWSLHDLFLGDDEIANKSRRELGFPIRRVLKPLDNGSRDGDSLTLGEAAIGGERFD